MDSERERHRDFDAPRVWHRRNPKVRRSRSDAAVRLARQLNLGDNRTYAQPRLEETLGVDHYSTLLASGVSINATASRHAVDLLYTFPLGDASVLVDVGHHLYVFSESWSWRKVKNLLPQAYLERRSSVSGDVPGRRDHDLLERNLLGEW
jgi:hypothetical protein